MPGCILLEDSTELFVESNDGCLAMEGTAVTYPVSYPDVWWAAAEVSLKAGVSNPWNSREQLATNQPACWAAISRLKSGVASPWQAVGATKSGVPNPWKAGGTTKSGIPNPFRSS